MSYEPGKWLVICDRCGKKRKAPDEVKETWDGLKVCTDGCFEHRHIGDFIRPQKEQISVPYTRPQPQTDQYTTVTYISESVGNQTSTIPSGNSGNGTTL